MSRKIFERIKKNIDLIIAFIPIAFLVALIILMLSGIIKVHIEFS